MYLDWSMREGIYHLIKFLISLIKIKKFKEKGNSFFSFARKLYVAETNCSELERAGHVNSSTVFSVNVNSSVVCHVS